MADRKNILKYFVISLFLVTLVACRTTIHCPDQDAQIFVDETFVGTGTAEISSIGIPKTVIVTAKKDDRIIGKTEMSRRFTVGTFFTGFITYYTGWIWAWHYPDFVVIPILEEGEIIQNFDPWANPRMSVWSKGKKKK